MFSLPDSFSAVPRASDLVFDLSRSQTRFRRNRWRRVPFSFFACPDSFSTVTSVPGPVFMFCAPRLVSGGTEGVGSHFHVLRTRTHFRRCRGCRVLIFHSRTHFLQNRGRQLPFSCFACLDSFSMVPRVSGPVFMCCAPRLIFGGTGGVGSRFLVLRFRTRFRLCRVRWVLFLAVPGASGLAFMFCVPGDVFGGSEVIMSYFQVLHARTRFRRYRGCRVSFSYFALLDSFSTVPRVTGMFSCFALPDMFSAVPTASGPVLMFCAP
jgi:hypothetical protein